MGGPLPCGHGKLPRLAPVSDAEALAFIEANGIAGSGIGWVDAHLLAAARLARTSLLTSDKALAAELKFGPTYAFLVGSVSYAVRRAERLFGT